MACARVREKKINEGIHKLSRVLSCRDRSPFGRRGKDCCLTRQVQNIKRRKEQEVKG